MKQEVSIVVWSRRNASADLLIHNFPRSSRPVLIVCSAAAAAKIRLKLKIAAWCSQDGED